MISLPATAHRKLAGLDAVTWTLGAITVVGALLRVRAYTANRSLWLDESFIALDIVRDGVGRLLGTLAFNQGAAPGFLLIEKAASALGRQELVLRFPSLVFGIAALLLLCALVRRRLSGLGAVFAAALFALSPAAIYYGSELKQYSADAAATVAVILVAAVFHEREQPSRRLTAAAMLVGVAAVVVSQSALFVVAGSGAVLLGAAAWERRPGRMRNVTAVVGVWAIASALELTHTLRTSRGVLQSYGLSSSGTNNGGEASGGHLHLVKVAGTEVANDLGLPTAGASTHLVTGFAALLALLGLLALLLRGRTVLSLLLTAPPLLTLVANATHHYPLSGRTLLFLVPIACICIGEGAAFPFAALRPREVGAIVAVVAVLAVAGRPLRLDAQDFRSPVVREEVRPLLRRLNAARSPGDRLFVVYSAQYALAYYTECGCGSPSGWPLVPAPGGRAQWAPALESTHDVTIEPQVTDPKAVLRLVRALPKGRTWLLVSHVADANEQQFLYERLPGAFAARGSRLETLTTPGARAMFFDIRTKPRSG